MPLAPLRDLGRRLRSDLSRWIAAASCAGRDFVIDDGLHWAASIAFYGVLSLFPLVLVGVDVASRFIDAHTASRQAGEFLDHFMPHAEIVQGIIERAVIGRPKLGLLSTLFLLYSGGRGFSVLIRALNIACDLDLIYSFFGRLCIELAMLLTISLIFLAALLSSLLLPVLGPARLAGLSGRSAIVEVTGWPLPSLLVITGFFCLYRFVPRRRCNWQSALAGSLVAAALCAAAKPVFINYVSRQASYSQVYGWMTIGIVFMIWAQLVAMITLYGGELASHVQMMIYDGLSGQEVSRRHRMRSPGRSTAAEEERRDAGEG